MKRKSSSSGEQHSKRAKTGPIQIPDVILTLIFQFLWKDSLDEWMAYPLEHRIQRAIDMQEPTVIPFLVGNHRLDTVILDVRKMVTHPHFGALVEFLVQQGWQYSEKWGSESGIWSTAACVIYDGNVCDLERIRTKWPFLQYDEDHYGPCCGGNTNSHQPLVPWASRIFNECSPPMVKWFVTYWGRLPWSDTWTIRIIEHGDVELLKSVIAMKNGIGIELPSLSWSCFYRPSMPDLFRYLFEKDRIEMIEYLTVFDDECPYEELLNRIIIAPRTLTTKYPKTLEWIWKRNPTLFNTAAICFRVVSAIPDSYRFVQSWVENNLSWLDDVNVWTAVAEAGHLSILRSFYALRGKLDAVTFELDKILQTEDEELIFWCRDHHYFDGSRLTEAAWESCLKQDQSRKVLQWMLEQYGTTSLHTMITTPLRYAVINSCPEQNIQLLIENGMEMNIPTSKPDILGLFSHGEHYAAMRLMMIEKYQQEGINRDEWESIMRSTFTRIDSINRFRTLRYLFEHFGKQYKTVMLEFAWKYALPYSRNSCHNHTTTHWRTIHALIDYSDIVPQQYHLDVLSYIVAVRSYMPVPIVDKWFSKIKMTRNVPASEWSHAEFMERDREFLRCLLYHAPDQWKHTLAKQAKKYDIHFLTELIQEERRNNLVLPFPTSYKN